MILFGKQYTFKKAAATGSYDASGIYVPGSTASESILADIQTLTTKELESLNVGRDNLGKIKIFCDEELKIATPGTDGTNLQGGDRVVFLGSEYEIIMRMPHENQVIPHFEYIAELR